MAVCGCHFNPRPALAKTTSATAIPPESAGSRPALYPLHGFGDSHTVWTRRTSTGDTSGGLMPDGWDCPTAGAAGARASMTQPAVSETFIAHGLVGFVDRTFQMKARRAAK